MSKKNKKETDRSFEDEKFPLPIYKQEDDIYSKAKEVPLEDEDQQVVKNQDENDRNLGEDLDIPGAELDDMNEEIGEEDEENNYYSLGGDNHEDLEEDKG